MLDPGTEDFGKGQKPESMAGGGGIEDNGVIIPAHRFHEFDELVENGRFFGPGRHVGDLDLPLDFVHNGGADQVEHLVLDRFHVLLCFHLGVDLQTPKVRAQGRRLEADGLVEGIGKGVGRVG
ncbi:hypothetical protein SDC9_61079 [bioreactor metagenome]|uniref:Uncharacterized protein n=1 Tax=bioreactor metagenome TaxID=1076179 RepID=A0A644XEU6_9ZZZZ